MTTSTEVSPQETVVVDGVGLTLNHRGALSPSELLTQPRLAIVGARAATAYGVHVAGQLAYEAAQAGYVVISGGAYGIDAAAHRGAILGGGRTVAVLACGVDVAYPRGNERMFTQMQEKAGAVFSEYPDGTAPTRIRFLARNRVIALLSTHVICVEAALRSGSLNTIKHALDFHRHTYAVPGPITSVLSSGTNQLLIDQQARALTGIRDLVIDPMTADHESALIRNEARDNALLADRENGENV